MRVVYYTHPAFFEPALCLIQELGRRVELHVLLELGPAAWQTAGFDLTRRPLTAGLMPAQAVLADAFPPGVGAYWEAAATFHLVVHSSARSFHPSSWALSRRALAFARAVDAEVLHVDDVDVSPRLALALPASVHPPLVLSVHDPQPHSGERNWRKRLARRMSYPRARRVVLYNTAGLDAFAHASGVDRATIDTTHLGPYDVLREWGSGTRPEPRRRSVLFFGRLSQYKGLDVFYDAARLVAARVAGTRFVVAGPPVAGYVPPPPPDLAQHGSIEVTFRYCSNAETAHLFESAALVVCPYRDATQSGVVLTAFAFGVPVIASAVGGLPEYVTHEHTGLLVPPGDAPALASAIERVLRDPPFAAQLRRNIIAAVSKEFAWRHTAEALVTTYERAAAR